MYFKGFTANNRVRSMVFQLGATNDHTYDSWMEGKLKRHSDGMLFKTQGIDIIPDWMLGWQVLRLNSFLILMFLLL